MNNLIDYTSMVVFAELFDVVMDFFFNHFFITFTYSNFFEQPSEINVAQLCASIMISMYYIILLYAFGTIISHNFIMYYKVQFIKSDLCC